MIHDRRPLLTQLADKVAVKDYITATIGPGYVAATWAVGRSVRDVLWSRLPDECVVKVNHGSGGLVMITTEAPAEARLPEIGSRTGWDRFRIRPEHADPDRILDLCEHWMSLDYSWTRGHASIQWCYSDIPRRILVKELLRDRTGQQPREYRLFVIGNKVRFIQIEMDVFNDHRTAIVDPQGVMLNVRMVDSPPDEPPLVPENLSQMVALAQILAEPVIDFVRVDMYDLGDRIVVGEMTHYPSGGTAPISSDYYSRLWGENWVVPYELCSPGPRY